MKRNIFEYQIIIVILALNLLSGCKKEKVPVITTTNITSLTTISAVSGGNITDDGGATVVSRGVCWSTGITPTISDGKTTDGTGAGSFSSNITGLNSGTSYYARAYATNSAGTGYGSAMSFTTLGQTPVPTISAATNINATGATLNGAVNPNYLSTTVTFEYGATTSYGSTITATQSPVTGNANTIVSAVITGLTEGGTTYHVRVKAANSIGTTYSNDITFTTLGQAPTGTTQPATSLNASGATLNGSVNANYASTVVTFEYGTTTSYGSTISATQSPVTGNTNTSVSAILSGLSPNTPYHFRVKTVNSIGTIYGSDLTFTTLGQSPTATTQAATNITTISTTVNGIVNANFLSTTVTFEYGTTITYDNSVTANQSPVSGNSTTLVSINILGLSPNTIYHYRVKAVNVLGNNYGSDMTFTTLGQLPTATTQAATNTQPFSSTLNGNVNANYLASTVTFEYGKTTSYGSTVTAAQSPVTGNTSTSVNASISGLNEGTVYHYRVKAINTLGTTNGGDMTFTTLGAVPTVTIMVATNITTVAAQLNGTINANSLSTTVAFEYGTTISYGTSVTATQSPITGSSGINVSATISGLAEGTIFHYRIVATNSLGTTNSNDMTFTTLGQVPTATILAATSTSPTGAQLNGTVNANYLSSTITFEYGTTTSYGSETTATQSPVTGSTNTNVSASITGLTYTSTYHFRIKAVNTLGTSYSADMQFTAAYTIGENINGGTVFYINGTGQHGLVCAPAEHSNEFKWGLALTVAGADGTAVGTGYQNTIDIVSSAFGYESSAKICSDLVLNGYNDWFLPSKDELGLMYTNLKVIGLGGFDKSEYWSSSEYNNSDYAWGYDFLHGNPFTTSKGNGAGVRAVRAF